MAVALGVARRGGLGRGRRHIYFGSAPVVSPGAVTGALVTRALARFLRSEGAVDLIFDSLGHGGSGPAGPDWEALPRRRDCVVDLDRSPGDLIAPGNPSIQRWIREVEGRGWAMFRFEGVEALDLLRGVMGHSQARNHRGSGLPTAQLRPEVLDSFAPLDDPFGLAVLGGFDGEALLSVALLGWGNRRAVYLHGGLADGVDHVNRSIWTHWRIMVELRAAGFRSYSLGPVRECSAQTRDGHPGFGKYESVFPGEQLVYEGVRWRARHRPMIFQKAIGKFRGVFFNR